jgi:hypothetical protein
MNPAKVRRDCVRRLSDLPNVGPAMSRDLALLGIRTPQQLRGKDPFVLYQRLSRRTGVRQDPCVLDTFIAVTRFMDGESPQPWWAYTAERKRRYGKV